jgi:hypothetical protein
MSAMGIEKGWRAVYTAQRGWAWIEDATGRRVADYVPEDVAPAIESLPDLLEALRDADTVLMMADRSNAWRCERDRCRERIATALGKAERVRP